jgi:penicillin-insensitive murein endopeptidase
MRTRFSSNVHAVAGIVAIVAGLIVAAVSPAAAEPAARDLFGARTAPAPLVARSIGAYSRGCLAGAVALPVNGPTWQVMRLSRNRNWGRVELVDFLERLAGLAPAVGWNGLLVGDLSQPRGGPMKTGHASHQIGLDADIWLTQMPARELSSSERETMSATSMLAADGKTVDPQIWSERHGAIIETAARMPEVARIFVNPAIKVALCEAAGTDRSWLRVVRPWWGHDAHFHVRLRCPPGDGTCRDQEPPPRGDGCGDELASWFRPPPEPAKPAKPKPPLTLADLPPECAEVLVAE